MTMLNKDSEFLSARDVARKLGISYKLARAAINDGQIPSTMIGKYRRVTRTALAGWLAKAQPVGASPSPATTQPPAAVDPLQPPPRTPGKPWSYAEETGLPPPPRTTGGA
jgi:excisionase family DNA binding protein